MAASVKKTAVIISALGVLLLGASVLIYGSSQRSQLSYINPSDKQLVASGKHLYAKNCASCHGAKLEGQPDWRIRKSNGRLPAPPHDQSGHTWHHADAVLIDITKNGLVPGVTAPDGYVSDMPAYNQLLSNHDIRAVLAYIKSSWPQHVLATQKDISQRQE
ncbi:c-type cytochrome [Denitrificimonas caeni]|uniref:c-type cytochrome n=1 Tax=Denitrificimonas caeni TaxID=521720 RepID=UPI001962F970|nr:cytochrome c [Denitrificimonas caeni]